MGDFSKKARFRHELKYIISLEEADRFFERIQEHCSLDPHAGKTQSYEIASTYYDTRDLRFYFDREESVGYRRKIRLRSYNKNNESSALFIEIKEKHKNFVNKKRINLKSRRVLDLGIAHNKVPLLHVLEDLEDNEAAREMHYLHKRLHLYPVVIIRYHRKALIPHFEHDMRITLDTNITAGGGSLEVFDSEAEKSIIKPSAGVLEIKTNQSIPLWLNTALTRSQMAQTRYSKYCLGVDAEFRKPGDWIPEEDESLQPELVEPEQKRRAQIG